MRPFSKRWLELLALPALLLLACAPPPPAPPASYPIPPFPVAAPVAPQPIATATPHGSEAVPDESRFVATVPAAAAPVAGLPPLTPAAAPSQSTPAVSASAAGRVRAEAPYKMGARPQPSSKAAYMADVRERRRWNDGGLGGAQAAAPEGHPDPRVIVDIARLRGPHRKSAVLRTARRKHWIKVIRCYRIGYFKDHELRGWTTARVRIGPSGKVRSSKLAKTELEDKQVAQCMADKLATIRFPRARASSRVTFRMRVGPGDDPVPRPDELIVAGDGELDPQAVSLAVQRGLPAIDRCYRQRLADAPAVWGRLVIRFHVDAKGVLDEAFETESRFPDPRLKQCVLRAARLLSFSAAKGGELRFEVPLRFGTPPLDSTEPGRREQGATK